MMTKKLRVRDAAGNLLFLAVLGLLIFVAVRYDIRCAESGSMEPAIRTGAICIVDPKAYESASPQVGDIAMYTTSTREVIHRIIREEADGSYAFKGDNNDAEDFSSVPMTRIKGRVALILNSIAPVMRAVRQL